MATAAFWHGKKVFLTGHTGFKGTWLCLWLSALGADVTGYALHPPTQPNLYELCGIGKFTKSLVGDVRNIEYLTKSLMDTQPEIVIHLAAQPLVQDSYKDPLATYAVNVMGTVHLFEAVRTCQSVKVIVNVTTDKCYENKEWLWGYRETDSLGGYDPYSNSKACSELVTAAYRNSFFNPADYARHGVAVASVRAGNVIGGGDWAANRLIPDCIRALLRNETILIRSPYAIRPWQHVLEPLSGYMQLAEKLYEQGPLFAEGWNLGPNDDDAKPVEWVVKKMCELWGPSAAYKVDPKSYPHEAHYLKLDCSKAKARLHWHPKWDLEHTLKETIEWVKSYRQGENMQTVCLQQIQTYARSAFLEAN